MTLKDLENELNNLEKPCDKCNYWRRIFCFWECKAYETYDRKYDELIFKIRDSEDYQKRMWDLEVRKLRK